MNYSSFDILSIYLFSPLVFYFSLLAFLLLLFKKGYRHEAIALVITVCILVISITLLKVYFAIPRPIDARIALSDFAFPSGHAACSIFLFTVFFYFMKKIFFEQYSWKSVYHVGVIFICIFIPLLVGVSRLYLGVHTGVQILGGYTLGLSFALCLIGYIETRIHK